VIDAAGNTIAPPRGASDAFLMPYHVERGKIMVREALLDFKALLTRLAGDPANLFTMIDTQGVLTPADWANELHPNFAGFRNLAGKFVVPGGI
jgi:hypothetical protein